MTEPDDDLLNMLEKEGTPSSFSPSPLPPSTPQPIIQPTTCSGFSMKKWLSGIVGNDIMLIFGDSGVGKTKMACQIGIDAAREGMNVIYYDHEMNIDKKVVEFIKQNNITYRPIPDYRDVMKLPENTMESQHSDLIIIDSATLCITGKWFSSSMQIKGALLQQLQGMYYAVKQWCSINKKTAIIIAQPISSMGDRKTIEPVGDKAQFMTKTILYLNSDKGLHGDHTNRKVQIFKSRTIPDKTLVTSFETTEYGIIFKDPSRMMKIIE
jgi:RecA/RadA recombinase